MTQDEYALYTGKDNPSYSAEDWIILEGVAEERLASFLCLAQLPTDDEGNLPDKLKMLLANFMAQVFKFQGDGNTVVSSKSVRNFTISFRDQTAVNAFSAIAANYNDIIEIYSDCGDGLNVEHSMRHCWYGRI